ncbi:hypothetical protein THF1C08_520002 [Vibrio jasicida]|uniref:Uncharacterized protein n=1 Tax=Vibrio jasicida TaxID=766224 RepID=A0AAU9QWK1_9VIBR|nr:hypothetical protein THF1C08_520002 [Vibrio jasicida]CAH1602057.1 hypothetical protein THF1A12_530002 [Vibrio jasicida]
MCTIPCPFFHLELAFKQSSSGVLSAKRAGCFTVALLTSHREDERKDADLIVQGFEHRIVIKNHNGSYCLAAS